MGTLANGLLVACFGAFLACCAYCIKKLWRHDTQIASIEARLIEITANCVRHQKWQEESGVILTRVDKMLTKVAAKLDVEIEE